MKKFIHVLGLLIVAKYESEAPMYSSGELSESVVLEVPEEIELYRVAVKEENGELVVYQRPLTLEEEFQVEVVQSVPYYESILKGQRAVAFFRLLNDKKGLTEQQKQEIISLEEIQMVIQMLMLGKLDVAALIIGALEVDGVKITENDKLKMLKFIGD